MKKKTLSLALALTMLLSILVACGSDSGNDTDENVEASTDTETTSESTSAEETSSVEDTEAADSEESAEETTEEETDETAEQKETQDTRIDTETVDIEGTAIMQSPAEDAAVVHEFEGLPNIEYTSLTGNYKSNEGLVIRQSYIEDGKVKIPANGLYYTVRVSKQDTDQFGENVVHTLGEEYNVVGYDYQLDVLTDAEFEGVGSKVSFGDGTKALELTGLSTTSPGFHAPIATFQILKPSGNYYGSVFQVVTDEKITDLNTGVLNGGTGREEGSYLPGEESPSWMDDYYYSYIAGNGASYLIPEEITEEKQTIKEFGTGAINYILLTKEDPVNLTLGEGETGQVGEWEVEVLSIGDNTCEVKLSNPDSGEELTKEFGPLTTEAINQMPANQVQRSQFELRPESNEVQVQLAIYHDPFGEDGKVKLQGFYDVVQLDNGSDWPLDDRFVYRLDTCSSCNLPIEIMLENKEPIELDMDNPVYEGPNDYFRIVLDDFDGSRINAWHLEGANDSTTENLAERADGQHIDLLVNTDNRTVVHFYDRNINSTVEYLENRVNELEGN